MAKQSGLGDNLYIAGYDLSGGIGSLEEIGGGPAVQEVPGINKSAQERIGLGRDGRIQYNAYWQPGIAANEAHNRLKLLPTADVMMTYARGTLVGSPAACMVAKQIDYNGTRAPDGSFTFKVQALANAFGLEWGRQLTAGMRTDGAAANGTGIDTTASLSFGGQAYLQIFAFTGTSVTVKIQDSADDISYADVAGFAFTAASAIGTERIAIGNTATLRRYLRAVTVGTFSNAVFSVVVNKNENAGVKF